MDETADVDVEKSCGQVKSHRFRCSMNQSTCLSVMALGNGQNDCKNKFDEIWFGIGRMLSRMNCNERRTDECSLLRRYIEQSWSSVNKNEIRSQLGTPFHWYCNSFLDSDSGEDENIDLCRQWWVCLDDQKRCRTGQCIDPYWLLDSEWDCADGSDVEELFYQRIETLEQLNPSFASINESQSRFGICNRTHPFACLSHDTSLNQYKCLEFTPLGDKEIDCLGAIDEPHTLQHCDGTSMLGLNFKCSSDNMCIPYSSQYSGHCELGHRCPNKADDEQWCFDRNNSTSCDGFHNFVCFDGSCVSVYRCDGKWQCPFGEDEYMCDYRNTVSSFYSYRRLKELAVKDQIHSLQLFHFPSDANITQTSENSAMTTEPVDMSL
ncbi:unnamed protein product, partial [Rotaria sp. Silwood1]